jgi:ABC-type sugar transport system substrate-binding protein
VKMNLKLASVAVAALLIGSAANAQDVIGYITKSATNAGWMMINQGAEDAAAAARGEAVSPRIDTGFFLVTPSTAAVYSAMVGIE